MTVAETFRSTPQTSRATLTAFSGAAMGVSPADCGERFRLRAEYTRRLAEFNAASTRLRMVARTERQGRAVEAACRAFREKCAACNAAWAQYRKHVTSHGCKHGVIEIASAA